MENFEREKILAGRKVVNLAYNLPGPVAAAELANLGAAVTKVEPPGGDPFVHFSRAWYQELVRGQLAPARSAWTSSFRGLTS